MNKIEAIVELNDVRMNQIVGENNKSENKNLITDWTALCDLQPTARRSSPFHVHKQLPKEKKEKEKIQFP